MEPCKETYLKYSLVGGVAKYWEFIDPKDSTIEIANKLYFDVGARLEFEPERLLKDEDIKGKQARAIMEFIGKGAKRPSEIVSRMEIKQASLSGPLQLLRDTSLVTVYKPFGEVGKHSKKTLYDIHDFALRFWFGVYSKHKTLWERYDKSQKMKLIVDHASICAKIDFLRKYRYRARHWKKDCEFDNVRFADSSGKSIHVSELKFSKLTSKQKKVVEQQKMFELERSKLWNQFNIQLEVLSVDEILERLAESK